MSEEEKIKKLEKIRQELSSLPAGYLSRKVIAGKERYYLQWNEDGKKRSKYVPSPLVDELRAQIKRRKELKAEEAKLSLLSHGGKKIGLDLRCNVLAGEALRQYALSAAPFKRRGLFDSLSLFLHGQSTDKVAVLYGLRRTGKTTLIRQLILSLGEDDFKRAAFFQIDQGLTMAKVNADLRSLYEKGYRYIFLDEVTLMKDFIDGAALFSDVFAPLGMKIFLSGTDSLSFYFSQSDQLYDRAELFHTTFIPYREFERVLGVKGIDEYIRYGGTMSLGGRDYNKNSPFAREGLTKEYLDSAIARNITHSLAHYQGGAHFRALSDFYQNDELVSAINRVVEDMNHRFTLNVLRRDFLSSDLALSARNLRNDREEPNDILDRIDEESFTLRLKERLEILNADERSVPIEEAAAEQIKEYLRLLGLIDEIEVASLPSGSKKRYRAVFSQPGLRYAQAEAFARSLLEDETFFSLPLEKRKAVLSRVLSEIRGRMMEEIVLLESKMGNPGKEVFQLQFASGEFDMVIFDEESSSCEVYEIKHSEKIAKEQYRHLIDEDKLEKTAWRYGKITRRAVIYRGEATKLDNGIEYLNVEDYLKSLD